MALVMESEIWRTLDGRPFPSQVEAGASFVVSYGSNEMVCSNPWRCLPIGSVRFATSCHLEPDRRHWLKGCIPGVFCLKG